MHQFIQIIFEVMVAMQPSQVEKEHWLSQAPPDLVRDVSVENCTQDSPAFIVSPPSFNHLSKAAEEASKMHISVDTKIRVEFNKDGIPTDISLVQSTGIKSIDRSILDWAKNVRYNKSPCQEKRVGFIPIRFEYE